MGAEVIIVQKIIYIMLNFLGCLGIALKIYHETKDAEKALKFIKAARSSMIELLVLKALAKDKQNFKGAILGLSRDMRSLYVHAYQSRVFNQLASRLALPLVIFCNFYL